MRRPTDIVAALSDALRGDPGRPLVTMYEDASGERVELSVATFDNWVCKLANLFSVEWELEPGDLVGVALPPHWQSMVAMMAAWTAGLTVSLEPAGLVDASVVGPGGSGSERLAGRVLACSLRPFGQGFAATGAAATGTGLPAGQLDWADEVPAQPDALLLPQPRSGTEAALLVAGAALSHDDLVARGLAAAGELGLVPGGRLATDLNPGDPAGFDVALLAPLVTGSSVVILVNTAPARRERLTAQERVTSVRWSPAVDG